MKTFRKKSYINFLSLLVLIVLLNFIAQFFYIRLDLTSEKRFTLSKVTSHYLKELDDIVFIKIYLDGDELPPGLKRLKSSVEEILSEFKVIGGENVAFEFINPNESNDVKERNQIYKELMGKGLQPTNIQERTEEGALTQNTVFSGALVYFKGQEISVDFLENNPTLSADQNLNNAIEDIEYKLMSSIKKLSEDVMDKIAFIEGHGELGKAETADLGKSLSDYYSIERIKIDEKIYALSERRERDNGSWAVFNKYKAIIIAGPSEKYSERDKFIIDQFIMNGGRVLWLMNGTNANMDSLATASFTMAMIRDVNLEDQLFTYGVRINADLVQDMQCSAIPLDVSPIGSKYPDFKLFPWPFFPLVSGNIHHAITRNMNLIKMSFASTIDTIGKKSILKRTPLLFSSNHSKRLNAPVRVDLNIVNHQMDPKQFNQSYLPTAYLLEGKFNSVFKNRLTPDISESTAIKFKEISRETKMIVISDASIMQNTVKRTARGYTPEPLDRDKFTGQIYGNKSFLINAVHYLCDDTGILTMRNKEFKIRLLDPSKIEGHKTFWQMLNMLVPLSILGLFGAFNVIYRRKKYKK
ncbi:MAG: gliding motility-associated ABC transporter substrate-binding protein GldG [Bacteroidales bacterium]|nr:gliding motility-associated ABC transporter substrate-binding protein GldG [Bacteroidales bacterium]